MNETLSEYDKAMAVLNDLAKDYQVWVMQDLANLQAVFEQAFQASGDEREKLIRENLFRIAHDMKGQGATFGYDLITDIGNHLCRYIERQDVFDEIQKNAIEVHINALRQIIEHQLTADGGKEGQALKASAEAF